MKKGGVISIVLLAVFAIHSVAKTDILTDSTKNEQDTTVAKYFNKKNIISTNVLSYSLKNYNITYSRILSDRWDIGAGVTVMPQTMTPFAESLYDFFTGYDPSEEEKERNLNNPILNLRTSGFTVFTRGRFFFPYKEYQYSTTISGVYIGPNLSYRNYRYTTSYDGSFSSIEFDVQGELEFKTVTAGIEVGNQWVLNNRFVIDFKFFLAGYSWKKISGYIETNTSDIDLKEYFEEVLNLNLDIIKDSDKVVSVKNKLDFENQKFTTYFITALRLGYLF